MEATVLPPGGMEAGENEHVTPAGRLEQEREIDS
jgi:hypothetical protein